MKLQTKKIITSLAVLGVLAVPVIVLGYASPTTPEGGLTDIDAVIGALLDFLWKVFAGLAVIMFIVAGILFMTAGGVAEKIATARQALIWGAIGVAVAIIAFSLVTIIANTIGG